MQNHTIWPIHPLPNAYPYLSSDQNADIAIVGGGLTGALCAWHLCQEGYSVILMTSGLLGRGETERSIGLLRVGLEEGFSALLKRIGPAMALEAYRAMLSAVTGLEHIQEGLGDCGFSRGSGIELSLDSREASVLRGEHRMLSRGGFNVEWLDAQTARRQFSRSVEGAMAFHGGVACVNPYALTHRLAQDCSPLRIYENTTVTQVRPVKGGILLRASTSASVRAKYAVIATGEPPKSLLPYTLRHRHLTISTLPPAGVTDWPMRSPLICPGEGLTFLIAPDGALLARQSAPALTPLREGRRQSFALLRRAQRLKSRMDAFFPATASSVAIAHVVTGRSLSTLDELPIISPVAEAPGVFTVSAYGTDGGVAGILAGRLILSWLRGESPPLAQLYSAERF